MKANWRFRLKGKMRHRFGDQGLINSGDFSKRCPLLLLPLIRIYEFSLGIIFITLWKDSEYTTSSSHTFTERWAVGWRESEHEQKWADIIGNHRWFQHNQLTRCPFSMLLCDWSIDIILNDSWKGRIQSLLHLVTGRSYWFGGRV